MSGPARQPRGFSPQVSRRGFAARLTVGAGVLTLAGLTPHALSRGAPAGTDLEELRRALAPWDSAYDPLAHLLVADAADGPGYHSTIKSGSVHVTRASLSYAAALLETGEPLRQQRAQDIARAVVELQDVDPDSSTYGLWPWYLEEPLSRMSPPDPNWADYCGMSLLMIWTRHHARLGPDLASAIRQAVLHAVRAIQRRKANPASTAIAVLGTGLTLIAAQEFKATEWRASARDRLRGLYDRLLAQGFVDDYNSPTYTVLVLQELSRMLLLVRDARDRVLITALNELAWKHAATHFHPPTQEWAGPHSRCYETNLARQGHLLAFLQKGCGRQVSFSHAASAALGLDAVALPISCPRKWVKYFRSLDAPRQVVENFAPPDPARDGSRSPLVGTTWLHPRFTLGSINRGDFWKQRRPLLAYWGTPSAPRFLRARFLKDDRDFSSALLFSAQHESHVLAIAVLATDHGDTHPDLDPIQHGRMSARDLRLVLEFGGSLGRCTVRAAETEPGTFIVQDDEVRWALRPVAERFGAAAFTWDRPATKLADRINAVAYEGTQKDFELLSLGEVFVCFALAEWPYDQKQPPTTRVEVVHAQGQLHARWSTPGRVMEIQGPTHPAPFRDLNGAFRSIVA